VKVRFVGLTNIQLGSIFNLGWLNLTFGLGWLMSTFGQGELGSTLDRPDSTRLWPMPTWLNFDLSRLNSTSNSIQPST